MGLSAIPPHEEGAELLQGQGKEQQGGLLRRGVPLVINAVARQQP